MLSTDSAREILHKYISKEDDPLLWEKSFHCQRHQELTRKDQSETITGYEI